MTIRHINLIDNNAVRVGFAALATADNTVIVTITVRELNLARVLAIVPAIHKVMLHPSDMRRLKASLILAETGETHGSA
jgi:hypothetical protein